MSVLSENPRLALVAAVLLVAATVFQVRNASKSPYPEEIEAYYQDMANQLETVTEGLPAGSKLVVLLYSIEYELRDKKELRKAVGRLKKKGFSVLDVVPHEYADEAGWQPSRTGYPYSEFLRVVDEFPAADAVVSFCGLPYGFKRAGVPPSDEWPLLLVANVETENPDEVESLLKDGWIQAAAVDRDLLGADAAGEASYIRLQP